MGKGADLKTEIISTFLRTKCWRKVLPEMECRDKKVAVSRWKTDWKGVPSRWNSMNTGEGGDCQVV